MILQTPVEIASFPAKIKHHQRILLMGSCFAENIAEKLNNSKFITTCNPFGVVYNPISLLNCFEILKNQKLFTENDLFFENGVWKSFEHHSSFSKVDKNDTLQNINNDIVNASSFLKKTDDVFITLGTSWIYEHIEKGFVVSNCHKVPSSNFNRKLLTVDETFLSLQKIVEIIKEINNNVQIIFTVSPIRHLKDGLHKNNVSKAILFAALNHLQNYNSEIYYFPAYEILIDELRDYRFYADDMLHPSKMAIEYIWNMFYNTFFDKETIEAIKKIEDIRIAMLHKPFFPKSKDYKTFKEKNYVSVCKLSQKYPDIDFNIEKDFFKIC
ncbi:MAG: hypothetical protein A2X08_16280 [Bacteroidetes bacterium GWA2_32_17]|nr:MAG: hypothetical protein A2X08_16280 [Bacteroidetes bacterium GWA2_32_17]